ncbi:RNA-guided endonuclease InsQ/TnpB family protein [Endozoicomonas euniceicola]|uniref:Transposase n=1 Tax=Endozoicomonas euniceicola TaxID=1234143 RepID=A0ABY6H1F8_9GAMM|nr:transposase [Endozoicomonas euniceicola]UYM18101.1 transposase [Endozoicomonas euniceicola]
MLKATKIRIYPTPDQAEFLNRQFGAVRMVWNKALAIKTHYYKIREQNLSPKKDLKPLLSKAKKSRKYSWLKEADSMALQQSVINLDKAFQNCKPIKARVHREITDNIKSITLTMTPTGKYYASVLAEDGKAEVKPVTDIHENHVTGVDVGLTDIVITSNGVKTGNPRFIKNAQRNLKRKQKKLSRCKKGSKGRAKARLLVAKAHERVAFARNDFQHKLSKQLIDENQAVIVETLKVKNMLKNHCLARSIADAGWHSLITKLDYKAKQAGKHLVKINQWFASCDCSPPYRVRLLIS